SGPTDAGSVGRGALLKRNHIPTAPVVRTGSIRPHPFRVRRRSPMPFSLPDLPYPYDALSPHMSKETLEYHHDKHHKAYVDTGNKLLEGSGLEGKSLEEVVKGSYGKNAGLFNNASQHYNHIQF